MTREQEIERALRLNDEDWTENPWVATRSSKRREFPWFPIAMGLFALWLLALCWCFAN